MTRNDRHDGGPDPFAGVPDIDERLADWVDGTMSPRDRERFEAEMRVNPSLRQQVEEYEQTVSDIQSALRADVHESNLADRVMAGLAQQATGADRGRRTGWPFVWATTCAAALLGIAVLIDTWGGASNPPPKTSAADHASHIGSPVPKPGDNTNPAPEKKANDGKLVKDGLSKDAKAFRVGNEDLEADKDKSVPSPTAAKTGAKSDDPASKKAARISAGRAAAQPQAGEKRAIEMLENARADNSDEGGEGAEAEAKAERAATGSSVGEHLADRQAQEKPAAGNTDATKKSAEEAKNKTAKSKKAKGDLRVSGDRFGQPRLRARGGRGPTGPGAPSPAGPSTGGPAGPGARAPIGPATGGPAGPTTGGPAGPTTGSQLGGGAGGPATRRPTGPAKSGAAGGARRGLATGNPKPGTPKRTTPKSTNPAPGAPAPSVKPGDVAESAKPQKPAEAGNGLAGLTEEQRRLLQQPTYKVRFARDGRPAEVLPLVTIEGLVLDLDGTKPKPRTGSDDFYLGSQKDDLGGQLREFFRKQMRAKDGWQEQLERVEGVKPDPQNERAGADRAPVREVAELKDLGEPRKFGRLTLFAVGPVAASKDTPKTKQRARRKSADRGRANADDLKPTGGGAPEVPGRKEAAGPEYVERDWLVVGPQSDVQRLLAALRNHAKTSRSLWRSGEARIAPSSSGQPASRGGGRGRPEEPRAQTGKPEAASPRAKAAPTQRLVIRFRVRR